MNFIFVFNVDTCIPHFSLFTNEEGKKLEESRKKTFLCLFLCLFFLFFRTEYIWGCELS